MLTKRHYAYHLISSAFMKKNLKTRRAGCDVNYGARAQEILLSDPARDDNVQKSPRPVISVLKKSLPRDIGAEKFPSLRSLY